MWKRVIAPVAVVSILWMTGSIITTYYISRVLESHTRTIEENVTTIDAAWAMRRDTWRIQVAVLEAGFQGDLAKAQNNIMELEQGFLRSLDDAKRTSLTPQERALIELITDRFHQYQQHTHQWLEAKAAANLIPSQTEREESLRLASAISDPCRDLVQINQQMIDDETQRNQHVYANVLLFRMGFLVLGPLVGLGMGLWVARQLNRSIAQVSITLKDASGRLGEELGSVAVSMSDELPHLQKQVHLVANRIQKVVNELEEAQRRVVQSERLAAVGELAAGVAHEIRNPLTSVKLLIQAASQRQSGQPMTGQQFEILLHEISRMEATIQGLLDFARPSRPHMIRHDVRQTLRRSLNLNLARTEQQHVSVVEDIPDEPAMVNGDPNQLNQVFVNLIINAVEAMGGGGILRVSVSRDGGVCRVRFSDSGTGIPSQILERLFEPFVTNKERGTGLGLAISRRIVEEHGGMLLASNRPEGGAELSVVLTLTSDSAKAPEITNAAATTDKYEATHA